MFNFLHSALMSHKVPMMVQVQREGQSSRARIKKDLLFHNKGHTVAAIQNPQNLENVYDINSNYVEYYTDDTEITSTNLMNKQQLLGFVLISYHCYINCRKEYKNGQN